MMTVNSRHFTQPNGTSEHFSQAHVCGLLLCFHHPPASHLSSQTLPLSSWWSAHPVVTGPFNPQVTPNSLLSLWTSVITHVLSRMSANQGDGGYLLYEVADAGFVCHHHNPRKACLACGSTQISGHHLWQPTDILLGQGEDPQEMSSEAVHSEKVNSFGVSKNILQTFDYSFIMSITTFWISLSLFWPRELMMQRTKWWQWTKNRQWWRTVTHWVKHSTQHTHRTSGIFVIFYNSKISTSFLQPLFFHAGHVRMMLKRLSAPTVPRFHYSPGAVTDGPSEGPSGNRLAYTQFSHGVFVLFCFLWHFIWGFSALSLRDVPSSYFPAAERALVT